VKKVLAVLTSVLFGIMLFGCSATEDSNSDNVTITMWNTFPELNEALEDFNADFEEEHPNINIELTNIPVNSQEQTYQAAVSEDTLPDIFTMIEDISLTKMLELDKVQELDSVFPEDIKDQYLENSWTESITTADDHTYVMPLYSPNHGTYMMYYNEEVLDEYGIDESNLPETWDDFMKVGKEIYEESDGEVYGLMGVKESWMYLQLIDQLGTAISPETTNDMNYKEGHPSLNSKGEKESIEFFKEMLDDNVLAPQSLQNEEDKAYALFEAGKSAFIFGGNWTGSHLNSDGFEEWGVAHLPTKHGEPYYSESSRASNGFAVSKETEHLSEVEIYLEYAIDHLYDNVFSEVAPSTSPKQDSNETPPFAQYEEIDKISNDVALSVPIPGARDAGLVSFDEDYSSKLKKHIGEVTLGYLSGEIKDLDGELNEIDQQANNLFKETLKKEKYKELSPDLFKFSNWEPFTDYTDEDYEELN